MRAYEKKTTKSNLLKDLSGIYGAGNIVETHEYKNEDTIVGEHARWTETVKGAVRTTKFYKTNMGVDENGFLRTPEYIMSWSKGISWATLDNEKDKRDYINL